MPSNPRAAVFQQLSASEAALLRRENRIARDVMAAYEKALAELQAYVVERFAALGDNPTPGQIRSLANDTRLVQAIDAAMTALQREFQAILSQGLQETSRAAFLAAQGEVLTIAQALGIPLATFGIDPALAVIVESVIDQIPGEINNLRRLLVAELRQGLTAGESMPDLAKRLFQKTPVDGRASVFRRGMTSADLMVRRGVIDANNNSKQITLERGAQIVPGLQKQAVAHIGPNTTETCLKVHGQVRNVDEPFDLTGEPRFARQMMSPAFHWHCRTAIVAYHPDYELSSGLKTADMRQAAQEQLAKNES